MPNFELNTCHKAAVCHCSFCLLLSLRKLNTNSNKIRPGGDVTTKTQHNGPPYT